MVSAGETIAWRRRWRVEQDRLLLRRLRWCVALTVAGVLVASLAMVVQTPPSTGKRLGFLFKVGAISIAAWELGRSRRIRAWARVVALGYVAGLAGLVDVALRAIPAERAIAAPACVALMTGTALLLPWGVEMQAAACVIGLLAYAWVATFAPQTVSAAAVVLAAVPVALVGARLLDEHRLVSWRRRWQQRQLVDLARDLAVATDPEAVVAAVLASARRLLDVDSVSFSSYHASRRTFRVDGITNVGGGHHWMQGFEVPDDFPIARDILAAGILAVPEDGLGTSIQGLLEEYGARHVLYVTLRCSGELVGMLGLVRTADVRFTREERRLARGLADQAALAIRTARLMNDLRRANRLKSEFVATMSHELRTPLTVILGFAEMARDATPGTGEHEEFLGRIEQAGRDLLGLIETTLEIGKMEAGRDEAQLEPVPLPAFWAGVGDACARLPRAAAVDLEWDAAVPDVALMTDPRKLSVVVRNLVGNALKFTERGRVRAELRQDGEQIVLRVSDTGIGIDPDDHATVFEMFRQADGSASRRYEGTGLGLYVVRRFVEQLGGAVTLESVPGQGSVFMVTLPRASDAPPLVRAA